MAYLEGRIGLAQVIDPAQIESHTIGFGATVTLLDMDSEEQVVYVLVGEDESDVKAGRISISAPIARAMIGKSEGDDVHMQLPKGLREFEVVKVEYKAIL
jgi:transcription elongation factor GreA